MGERWTPQGDGSQMDEQEHGGGVRSLNQVVQIDEGRIAAHLDEVVRSA